MSCDRWLEGIEPRLRSRKGHELRARHDTRVATVLGLSRCAGVPSATDGVCAVPRDGVGCAARQSATWGRRRYVRAEPTCGARCVLRVSRAGRSHGVRHRHRAAMRGLPHSALRQAGTGPEGTPRRASLSRSGGAGAPAGGRHADDTNAAGRTAESSVPQLRTGTARVAPVGGSAGTLTGSDDRHRPIYPIRSNRLDEASCSGSPVRGAATTSLLEPRRARRPGYPLESHGRRGGLGV